MHLQRRAPYAVVLQGVTRSVAVDRCCGDHRCGAVLYEMIAINFVPASYLFTTAIHYCYLMIVGAIF